jgi:hypothetical protein
MKKQKFSPLMFMLFLGVLHLLCASLSFASDVESSWKLGLSGANAQDSQSTNQYVSFGLDTKTKYWADRDLFLNFDALVKFENGSFQSLEGEKKNESGLRLQEVGAHWLLANPLLLSVGALNQATNHSDLLFDDQAFPAVRAQVKLFKSGTGLTSLELEQAIPTSSSLNTNTRATESTPRFLSASLSFNYETFNYFWNTRVGAYSFDNLPSSVAYQSGLRGNTVNSLTETESLFSYEFAGLDAESSLRVPVMRGWDFTGAVSYLKNNKAPTTSNSAYALTAGSEFFFVGQKSWDLSMTGFRIESDAAVAYFNSDSFFNTNRIGYNLKSYMNFRKRHFRVGVSYTEAEVIYLNPVQSREKSLMLMLETFYANI